MKEILTELPAADIWEKLPRWALIVAVMVLSPLAVYTVTAHFGTDNQQSEDIATLTQTVSQLAVVVEYNYKETERNSHTAQANNELIHETQMRLERILGRIENRLDEEDN